MERFTKYENGKAVVRGDSIYSDWGSPEGFRGEAVDALARYEDTGLEPEEISKWRVAVTRLANVSGDRILEIAKAEQEGHLVVLDQEMVLAIAAGLAAIRNNKKLLGVTWLYDVFGEDGGPYEITYHRAAEILCEIWNKFPLEAEAALEERGSDE